MALSFQSSVSLVLCLFLFRGGYHIFQGYLSPFCALTVNIYFSSFFPTLGFVSFSLSPSFYLPLFVFIGASLTSSGSIFLSQFFEFIRFVTGISWPLWVTHCWIPYFWIFRCPRVVFALFPLHIIFVFYLTPYLGRSLHFHCHIFMAQYSVPYMHPSLFASISLWLITPSHTVTALILVHFLCRLHFVSICCLHFTRYHIFELPLWLDFVIVY